MREFKFRYIFEDIKEDGRTLVTQIWNLNDIEINDIVYDTKVLIARNQYTGLKDKNNVEIYEGDIMQSPKACFIGVVEFIKGVFIVSQGQDLFGKDKFDVLNTVLDFEVIGNIYENPDLLNEI